MEWMKKLNECKDKKSGTSFARTEKRATFVLQSEKNFYCEVVDIDHCVLEGVKIRRCDWLFLVPKKENPKLKTKKPKAYYIELKGDAINEACEQLYHAIDKTKSQIPDFEIETRVVGTKGIQPEILNSEYYRKVKRITKKDIEFCKVHKGNDFTHIENIQ